MDKELKQVLVTFKTLLNARLAEVSERNTSESDIRSLFCLACLLQKNGGTSIKDKMQGVNDIILEKKDVVRLEKRRALKLDMLVNKAFGFEKSLAIEFKYHRFEGKKTPPKNYWAGWLLHDVYRLQNTRLEDGEEPMRLAVYVANKKMMEHYAAMPDEWQMRPLMNLKTGGETDVSVTLKAPETSDDRAFLARIRGQRSWNDATREIPGFTRCHVRCLMSEPLAGEAELHIFEISNDEVK